MKRLSLTGPAGDTSVATTASARDAAGRDNAATHAHVAMLE
jgi:hypothetical protein